MVIEGGGMGVADGQPLTDVELLFRLDRGDTDAFRHLFRRHERTIYRAALAMTRSSWDAEDVVSATFLELWKKRDHVRIVDGTVLPWLLTVASYQAKNHLRAARRYQRLLAKVPLSEDAPDHADEVARMIDALPMTSAVEQALRELNSRDASVLLLCVVRELSVRDAAIALGVPEGTVKSRLSRVKARLRVTLGAIAPRADGAEA